MGTQGNVSQAVIQPIELFQQTKMVGMVKSAMDFKIQDIIGDNKVNIEDLSKQLGTNTDKLYRYNLFKLFIYMQYIPVYSFFKKLSLFYTLNRKFYLEL